MLWHSYSSFENEKINPDNLPNGTYIVTEKFHGCNFALEYNPESCKIDIYSRNHCVTKTDFNKVSSTGLLNVLTECLKKLEKHTVIYGELYGLYVPDKNAKKKNGRIYYSPKLEFIAFDVLQYNADRTDMPDKTDRTDRTDRTDETEFEYSFLPFFEAQKLCIDIGIDFVDALFQGPRDDAYNFAKENADTFKTTRQKKVEGRDDIQGSNIEGFVWRNVDKHILVKRRSTDFLETNVQGYSRPYNPDKEPKTEKPESPCQAYININRYNSVLSKMPVAVTKENIQDLIKEFIKDVETDIVKDGIDYKKEYNKLCSTFVFNTFLKKE